MEIGDVFLPADLRINDHPRVVISHPQTDPEAVVLVNFTGFDDLYKDDSCILEVGDYAWLTKRTCISYRDAKLAKETDLDALVRRELLRVMPPVSDAVLAKILEGAERTEELPGKCRRVLERQGLIGS